MCVKTDLNLKYLSKTHHKWVKPSKTQSLFPGQMSGQNVKLILNIHFPHLHRTKNVSILAIINVEYCEIFVCDRMKLRSSRWRNMRHCVHSLHLQSHKQISGTTSKIEITSQIKLKYLNVIQYVEARSQTIYEFKKKKITRFLFDSSCDSFSNSCEVKEMILNEKNSKNGSHIIINTKSGWRCLQTGTWEMISLRDIVVFGHQGSYYRKSLSCRSRLINVVTTVTVICNHKR